MRQPLTFRIDFLGPFAVGTGIASAGIDAPVDVEVPLPGSALKGVLRAEGNRLVSRGVVPAGLVAQTFGTAEAPASWRWQDAAFDEPVQVTRHARLRLDGAGGAVPGFLLVGHHAWGRPARMTLTPTPRSTNAQELLLRACALGIQGLGGGRRRGEGWVSLVQVGPDGDEWPWTAQDTRALRALGAPR